MNDEIVSTPAGAGFEAVLANAALRGVGALVPPPRELMQLLSSLVRHPQPVARQLLGLSERMVAVAAGAQEDPGKIDRRFTDAGWAQNPLLRRVALGYLAACDTAASVLEEADLDWRTRERLRISLDNSLSALAPTNNPALNPSALKTAVDTGGMSLVSGAKNLAEDLRSPTKLPAGADKTAFRIGENIAATPGKVVRRERLYELLEYEPTTDRVDAVPVVLVPSPVNKYYLVDLEPRESAIRAEIERGRRVFIPSWVNPDKRHADVGFDAYVSAIVEVIETVNQISGSQSCHLLGLCGGGALVFLTAGHLAAAERQDLLATLTISIAVIDYDRGPSSMAFVSGRSVERSIKVAERRGYFDARDSARSFALMRPHDGVWANVVNNYLLGRRPPASALLYWAADQTNMTARFGAELLRAALNNEFVRPGAIAVLGTPLDPRQITVDTYILGASTDHISPWTDCYRTAAVLGGQVEFVLAKGGHAVVIAKGPGARRASYRTGVVRRTAEEWLTSSTEHDGSWWEHWNDWLVEREPKQCDAPTRPGSDSHPAIADAPGEFVTRRLT